MSNNIRKTSGTIAGRTKTLAHEKIAPQINISEEKLFDFLGVIRLTY
ncbi:MAG: hypothetical protein IJ730_02070 [Alphaproteobacteria bacterium]|nr:hypothetical protein [Alphaproteobacteria bacterium]